MRLKTLATHPVWREPRTVFGVWMLTGVIFAIVKLLIGKYNNYKIFEGVYWHAIEGLTLYGDHYPEYYDSNHYGVLFSLIIAPFALLPEWLGIPPYYFMRLADCHCRVPKKSLFIGIRIVS